jgi:hypothetical protein
MSLEGRISVDVLFHDKDGTASLKVVSLQDSKAYATGKVAVITGTLGTASSTISHTGSFRGADGEYVSITSVNYAVFRFDGTGGSFKRLAIGNATIRSNDSIVSASCVGGDDTGQFTISGNSGSTGTYAVVLYGT